MPSAASTAEVPAEYTQTLLRHLRQVETSSRELCACELVIRHPAQISPQEALGFVDRLIAEDSRFVEYSDGLLRHSQYQLPVVDGVGDLAAAWSRLVEHKEAVLEHGVEALFNLFHHREAEYLVASLFEHAGVWLNVRVTRASGDGGVDILAGLPASLTQTAPVFAQVKWYQPCGNNVGLPEVLTTIGAANGSICYVITTSSFTREARFLADSRPGVFLIDRIQLMELARLALQLPTYSFDT